MAHENLKFRLQLDFNKDKDKDDTDRWQPVFGGQHHGTFYMIYIDIKSYETEKINDDIEIAKLKCSFRLQNYRGAITMGLERFRGHQFETLEETDNRSETILNFNLEAAPFKKNDYLNDVEITLEKPITSGLIAVFKVFVLPPPASLFDPENLDNSLYLNPYTHLRDGDQYTEVAFRKSGTTDQFRSPTDMGWPGMGFCIPDICIFD